jgi:hypothetical protein
MSIMINLGQAIHALSDALDLVGVDEVCHGKRVGCMALHCGRGLGLSDPELADLFHDCGVSSTHVHHCLVSELDWENSEFHCIRGSEQLSQFAPLAHLAPIVRYHHMHWNLLRTQALAQQRPYRKPLAPHEIIKLLRTIAERNQLDSGLVEWVARSLAASWQAATGLKSLEEFPNRSVLPDSTRR